MDVNDRSCPWCGEGPLIFYAAEASDEPDVWSCPECAYTEMV